MTHWDNPEAESSSGQWNRPARLLVYADDPLACAATCALFSGFTDLELHPAESRQVALDVFTSRPIDLVLLSPSDHANAMADLRAFADQDRRRRIPLVVAWRSTNAGDALAFLAAGADDAVSNLDSDAELVARVRCRLAQKRERDSQTMARRYSLAGDLTGLGLTDLIMVLEQSALTGTLDLITRRGAAQLLMRGGQIQHASFGSTRGRVALFELLREREGQFEFTPGNWVVPADNPALEGPNTVLLLEGSQAMDENPDEAPAVLARPLSGEMPRVAAALQPSAELAEQWLSVLADPAARGEIRLLSREQVREWTSQPAGGARLRMALVTDVACGVQIVSHLAAPLTNEEVASTLRRPPVALGFTWKIASGATLEILLLDQERLKQLADVVLGSPAVLVLAPSYGDFLTYNVGSRAALQQLLRDTKPLAILAVGNQALEGQLGTFLKLAKYAFPTEVLRGSLWKLEVTPRALLEAAIRQWAALPAATRARAA